MLTLRSTDSPSGPQLDANTSPVRRTTRLLSQASLCDLSHVESWVPIAASTAAVSIHGCVSLMPTATKKVQFISIGVKPVFNKYHSTVLFEEGQPRVSNSAFGVVEEATEQKTRGSCPGRWMGLPQKPSKPDKGIDRWPMFRHQHSARHIHAHRLLGRRPRYSTSANARWLPSPTCSGPCSRVPQNYTTSDHRTSSARRYRAVALMVPRQASNLAIRVSRTSIQETKDRCRVPRNRASSIAESLGIPLRSWSRVKAGHTVDVVKPAHGFEISAVSSSSAAQADGNPRPLVGKSGNLLRRPFNDRVADSGHDPARIELSSKSLERD